LLFWVILDIVIPRPVVKPRGDGPRDPFGVIYLICVFDRVNEDLKNENKKTRRADSLRSLSQKISRDNGWRSME
jgi:hypothetical protein